MSSNPRTEYRDNQVVVTEDYLYAGVHEYNYLIRPTLRGTARRPNAESSLMYEPEIFGRSGTGMLTVK